LNRQFGCAGVHILIAGMMGLFRPVPLFFFLSALDEQQVP
jgi:hypothetical protein